MNATHIRSKRRKTAILLKHPSLRNHVPATYPFSRVQFHAMLMRYESVFAKPNNGRFGKGVIKIQRWGQGYRLQYVRRVHYYDSFGRLFNAVKKRIGKKSYILQQGIDLIKYQNRPFDIRIMVQKTPANKWKTTGILARVAAPGRIVTNFHAGGTAHSLSPLLSAYLPLSKRRTFIRQLRLLGRKVARHYDQHVRKLNEIGVDVALDELLQPWILEVNTRPDAFVFKQLPNPSMFKTIMRYARKYGKYKRKRPFVRRSRKVKKVRRG